MEEKRSVLFLSWFWTRVLWKHGVLYCDSYCVTMSVYLYHSKGNRVKDGRIFCPWWHHWTSGSTWDSTLLVSYNRRLLLFKPLLMGYSVFEAKSIFFFVFFFLALGTACEILVPWPRIQPMPTAMEAWSPNNSSAREFPEVQSIFIQSSGWRTSWGGISKAPILGVSIHGRKEELKQNWNSRRGSHHWPGKRKDWTLADHCCPLPQVEWVQVQTAEAALVR